MPLVDEHILSILRCPNSGESLSIADDEFIALLNQRILDGQMANATGESVDDVIDGGLVNESATWLSPVYGRIIDLNPTDAIDLQKLALSRSVPQDDSNE
ncbi:MAG: hypothetical protein ACJZ8O_01500 [Pirellulaceae bacterium]